MNTNKMYTNIFDNPIWSCKTCIYVKAEMGKGKSSTLTKWVYRCKNNETPLNCNRIIDENWKDKPYNKSGFKSESFIHMVDDTENKEKEVKQKMKETEMEYGQEKLVPVDLELGEIELPQINIKPYLGKEVKIATVTPAKGAYGYCLKVETEIVDTITGGKRPIYLRGSRIFGLHEDAEGKIGWGNQTKLGVFLKKMKVKTPNALIGKLVILQSTTSKGGTDFLTFN